MATLTKGYTFGATESVTNAKLHALVDSATITGIVNADVDVGAAIAFSKIAQTDIDGSKLTGLNNIVSGAGVIPVANIPVGTTANKIMQLDASAKIPALDGSQLTGMALFGAWVDKTTSYGAQQAATDGFVMATIELSASCSLIGYTDSNANPTTARIRSQASSGYVSLFFPVKKSDYWKVTVGETGGTVSYIYWIPSGG